MRKVSPKKYAVGLYEALASAEKKDISVEIGNFVRLLTQNKDMGKAEKIIAAFDNYFNEQKGIQRVDVVTGRKLNQKHKKEISDNLNNLLNKEIDLRETVDKSLIGGLVVKYGDTVIDGSVKKSIELLSNIFTNK